MSEKTTIPKRPPGLPFGNNCDDVNAQIVRNAHDAQWQRFIATGNNLVGSPLPLIHSVSVALKGESAMVTNWVIKKADLDAEPDLVAYSSEDAQALNPPPIPDFLLRLFAKSKRDQAAVGDINELYNRDCAKFGRARAGRLYWAGTLRFLWPLLVRTISRAMKLAVIIDALKRYFG